MKKRVRYTAFSPEAIDVYEMFARKEGAQYIATPVTLQALLDMNKTEPFARVLEMGAGIGTITFTVLKHTSAHIDTYENNDFCQKALRTNLVGFESRYTLMEDYRTTPPQKTYDLVVIDGGGGKGEDGGTMPVVQQIARSIDARVFYIEGGRHIQRVLLRRALAERYVYHFVQYEPAVYNGVTFKGGLAIMCTPSSSALLRKLNFYLGELVEWTPVKQAVAYRLKKLFGRAK